MSKLPRADYPIVGLGGSAGALPAFFDFFEGLSRLGERPGMAVVVVLHLGHDDESHLVELLEGHTLLPARGIEETVEIEPDVVYVVPPDRTLVAEDGRLATRARRRDGEDHPVDDLFVAIAAVYGERAGAIVCSGTGSNGSAGIAKVQEAGGCVLAQSPETAEFDDMPRRAISTGFVDVVLPTREMAETLARTARRLCEAAPEGAVVEDDTAPAERPERGGSLHASSPMARILVTLRACAGMDFRQYKPGTLERRIERRAHLLNLNGIGEYADYLREHEQDADALVKDLLISVTSFFRDVDAWRALSELAIAPLVKGRSADEGLRAWVAGCATGEEAWSIAMSLFEARRANEGAFPIAIFATDASKAALSRAREGVYPAAAVQHLSRERREQWFDTRDDTVSVKTELREAMIFAPQNLA
nr:chemotaxis protein CheB [Pararhodobacter sp. SW119]